MRSTPSSPCSSFRAAATLCITTTPPPWSQQPRCRSERCHQAQGGEGCASFELHAHVNATPRTAAILEPHVSVCTELLPCHSMFIDASYAVIMVICALPWINSAVYQSPTRLTRCYCSYAVKAHCCADGTVLHFAPRNLIIHSITQPIISFTSDVLHLDRRTCVITLCTLRTCQKTLRPSQRLQ